MAIGDGQYLPTYLPTYPSKYSSIVGTLSNMHLSDDEKKKQEKRVQVPVEWLGTSSETI